MPKSLKILEETGDIKPFCELLALHLQNETLSPFPLMEETSKVIDKVRFLKFSNVYLIFLKK